MKLYERYSKNHRTGECPEYDVRCRSDKAEMLAGIRRIVPDHFLVGARSRSSGRKSRRSGKIWNECTLWLDSQFFRGIIFADRTRKFCRTCTEEAFKLQKDMERLLVEGKVL